MHHRTPLFAIRRLAVVFFCAAVAAVATAPALGQGTMGREDRPTGLPYETPGGLPQLSPDYNMTSHKVVLITEQALNPRLVTLDEGQLVAWISYSPTPSVIVFEREVARSMICHSLVNFSIKDDELRSAPIHAGEFASFCQLKPGRYKYKIVRPQPIDDKRAATITLEGEIIVGNPDKAGAKS
jgi:hypothetical protein